jgi:hypothetical protein
MNQQPPDIVGTYAKLQIIADRYYAAGQQPPANVVRALQAIETRARATLSPQQLQAAEHHAHIAKDRILREMATAEHARQEAKTRQYVNEGVRKLTRGMAGATEGLTPEQFQAVRDGRPIPARRAPTQAERDAAFRANTVHLDPQGRGWTEREWTQRLDQLADASEREFSALSRNYLADPTQLQRTATTWRTERVGYEVQKRRAERDAPSREYVANDDDQRRADVIAAYADHAYEQKRPDFMDDVGHDPIPERLLQDESRTGDIARAWNEVDARGDSDGSSQ